MCEKNTYVIVVPCYNEHEVIELYTKKMTGIIDLLSEKIHLNVLFVDDGSIDNTLKMMQDINKKDNRFGYLRLSRNFGKEAAMLAGMTEAYNNGADYIGVMDVDLQDPPELILKMVHYLEDESNDIDCVALRRTTRNGEPPIRSLFARTFYKIMNSISNTNMEDGARDFRIMSRNMTEAIMQMKDRCRFSKGIFGYVGFHIHWIDYENIERAAGVTKWSFYKLMLYALDGITGFTESPLRTASLVSGAYAMIQFLLFILNVILRIRNKTISLFYLLGSEYLTRSILFVMISMIGFYLVRVAKETKDRPQYILSEKILPKN